MLYNYLKVAIRNLKRNALFSFINIIGLALSMSVCLIALSVIRNAFTYDNFHPYPQRTYRIVTEVTGKNGNSERWATAPLPLAQQLRGNYSFVENLTAVYTAISSEMSYGEKAIGVEGAFADPSFFKVFGFELLYGDKITALAKPNSIVLTEETAALFFKAGENPVGKIVSLKQLGSAFIVTGVIKNSQQKTHLSQKVYASMSTVPALEAEKKLEPLIESWKNYGAASIYMLVKENTHERAVQQALTGIASTTFKQHPPQNIVQLRYDLQRLDHITAGEELINGGNSVSRTTLLGIGGITLLILLMACFNYTNLSLARMLARSKEVGIRKVIGGTRLQVFLQFIT